MIEQKWIYKKGVELVAWTRSHSGSICTRKTAGIWVICFFVPPHGAIPGRLTVYRRPQHRVTCIWFAQVPFPLFDSESARMQVDSWRGVFLPAHSVGIYSQDKFCRNRERGSDGSWIEWVPKRHYPQAYMPPRRNYCWIPKLLPASFFSLREEGSPFLSKLYWVLMVSGPSFIAMGEGVEGWGTFLIILMLHSQATNFVSMYQAALGMSLCLSVILSCFLWLHHSETSFSSFSSKFLSLIVSVSASERKHSCSLRLYSGIGDPRACVWSLLLSVQ